MSNYPPQGGYPPPGAYPGGGAPPPPKKSNMKWILLGGGGCLLVIILVIGGIIALVGGGVYMLANSEASQTAQRFVQQSSVVKSELGEPLSTSFASGNITTDNGVGTAEITVSVTGPKGSGSAVVKMGQKGSGPWSVTSAEFTGPGGDEVDLK